MTSPRVPRFWDCCIPQCSAAAAIDIGACEHCRQHFCAAHVRSSGHECDDSPLDGDAWDAAQFQELENLRQMVNDKNLLGRASECNGQLSCELDSSDYLGRSRMGGMHIHLQIKFSNGTTWLARILRHNFSSFSDELSNLILESECATLKWLERRKVPSPRLHGYGLRHDPDNDVGVAYMLIDELPGTPLLLLKPSDEQLQKVYTQYADILCTIYKSPFEQIGCPTFLPNGDIGVGPIVGDRTGTFPQMGPFHHAREYYSEFAENYLNLIFDYQLFSAFSIDAYLVFKFLQDLARQGRWNAFDASLDDGPFFLKHMDDKGDHILVDEDYNITGLIDWTFARVVPTYEAFGPSLLTGNLNDIFNGKTGPSQKDKLMVDAIRDKCKPLTCFAEGPDHVRRFSFALGMGMNPSLDEIKSLFKGILCLATGIDLDLDWDVWRRNRLIQWSDDARLQQLLPELKARHNGRPAKHESRNNAISRFATCSVDDCARPSVRGLSCPTCRMHLCATHQSKEYHKCPSASELDDEAWEKSVHDEVSELLSHVNTRELAGLGTKINNDIGCNFKPGKYLGDGAIMGCANYHAELIFDNGDKWLVRIPRADFSDVPADLVEYFVSSEYATLKFLEATNVPAPKVFGHGLASDPTNRVGVSYILMQILPGKPFNAFEASQEQKQFVLKQLAEIMIEISKHPFPLVGSLVMEDGEPKVSTVASNRFVALGTYGPFQTSLDYLNSITEQYLDLIADKQLYKDTTVEAFLLYWFLKQNAPKIAASNTKTGFFLKHVDDKGDHLLVDESFRIQGTIDWQFSRIVPAIEAFGPSYMTADLSLLYSSKTGLTEDDLYLAKALRKRGATEIASHAEGGEVMRRFHHGLASGLTRKEARDVLKGIIEAVEGQPAEDIDMWIMQTRTQCRHDPRGWVVETLTPPKEDRPE